MPVTSRLAPAIIWPAASSTVAIVRTPPGRNVASGRDEDAHRVVAELGVVGHREHRGRDDEGGDDREDQVEGGEAWELEEPDEDPEGERDRHPAEGRLQQQGARPAVRIPWPSTRTAGPNDGSMASIRASSRRPSAGLMAASSASTDEVVQLGDLVEPVADPLLGRC